MNSINNVLSASHGTTGAQAAVSYALNICQPGASIRHLVVVPEFWKGMMGDDWLNNGISRDRYARYLESELGKEIDEHIDQVQQQTESKNFKYSHIIQMGEPHKCLISASLEQSYDLVVIGSVRPKGTPGLNSKMTLDKISGQLKTPLIIVPYPQ